MIQYLKKNKAAVNLEDTPLATPGGEGSVYKIINMPGYCAKIYHPDQLSKERERKIEYLIKNQTHQQLNDRILICWPIDLVYNKSGNFMGFTMPLAFSNSIDLYEIVTLKIRSHLDNIWKRKFDRNTVDGIQNRLKVCVNIAIALHILHQTKQYVLVDFKPKNILITSDGKVSITDIDSIQVFNNGKALHYAKVATPEYAPKESEKLNPANDFVPETWDRFSLAIVFYEILFGIHPYAATAIGQYDSATTIDEKIRKSLFVHGSKKNYLSVIPTPHTNYNILPDSIKNLFIKAFETGSINPLLRPSAEDWGKVIVDELSISNIRVPQSSPIVPPIVKSPKVIDQIKIISNPLGASVFYNSQELGITPCFLNKDEYINKVIDIVYDNQSTTVFVSKNKSEIYTNFQPIKPSPIFKPVTNKPSTNWWKILRFTIGIVGLLFITISLITVINLNGNKTTEDSLDFNIAVKDTTASAVTDPSPAYNEYGVGKGKFFFWTKDDKDGEISIFIDGKKKGKLSQYFTNEYIPNCNTEGICSVILSAGIHHYEAFDNNKYWKGTISVIEGKCEGFELLGSINDVINVDTTNVDTSAAR